MTAAPMPRMRRACAIVSAFFLCLAAGCARPSMSNDAFSSPELSPLADAVGRGDAAEIRRQLERVDADAPGSDGSTLLLTAIGKGRLTSVQALLEGGADPNRAGPDGETAVHAAAFSGKPELLQTVLAHGGDADARNPHTGETPLMRALLSSNRDQYRVLLDAGADPGLADRTGDTALHFAARTNNGDAILSLLDKGAPALARNSGGASFQSYYFGYNRAILNERALGHRRAVVSWLRANGVPLEAEVSEADQQR
jgi:ankyrin repeat protein